MNLLYRTKSAVLEGLDLSQSLDKDAPVSRPVQGAGSIKSHAVLVSLHHHYVRI
jgi:hypothetical protein